MAGWQAYITNLLDSSDGIKRAAIVGYPDASVWARSEGASEFKATEAELRKLVQQFGNLNEVPSTGADLEGVHYIVPRTEENLIFGKKEKTGFFAAKTAQAILIALFEGENAAGSEARTAVEKLAQYLTETGY
ncbi:Profilin family protein [Aphelenchoides avenae]|nr:Profilin family protein [Aphelenchus avenae]KAH7720747.1 Profilin family protein [Aphelenchus avenae]